MNDWLYRYCRLLTESKYLAMCRRAGSLPQFLSQLKKIWQQDGISDSELLDILDWCNRQILDLDVQQLTGNWLPHRYDMSKRCIHWCLPDTHPVQPFHDEYVGHCRQNILLNQLIQPRTTLASLEAAGNVLQPAGFIFHLSRCGSTLVSGCLAELNDTCVLSESQLLTNALLDESLNNAQKAHLLPRLVALQSCLYPGRDKCIIKWNAWDIFNWALLRQIYPDVPVVILMREPVEVLASHERYAGRHMAGDPTLADLHSVFASQPSHAATRSFRTEVLGAILREMAASVDAKTLAIDYSQLNAETIVRIANHFGLSCQDAGATIMHRMNFHSKDLQQPFESRAVQENPGTASQGNDQLATFLALDYQRMLALTGHPAINGE